MWLGVFLRQKKRWRDLSADRQSGEIKCLQISLISLYYHHFIIPHTPMLYRHPKAFTIIELLIIVIIIGILVISLIPRLSALQSRARDVVRKWDLQQLTTALASYRIQNQLNPSDPGGIDVALGSLSPLFVRSLPSDPRETTITTNGLLSAQWQYLYIPMNNNQDYALIAVSEAGGSNANWISNTNSTTLTGWVSGTDISGLIRGTDTAKIINYHLCMRVDAWLIWRNNRQCTASIGSAEAKYVVAN